MTDKEDMVKQAINMIEKKYGKGSIMLLNQETMTTDIEIIKTGSVLLNMALGVGGIPRGRVVEIYGPEAWETTIALHIIAEAQKRWNSCFYRCRTRS